uniref:Serine/threonine-protein kinase/endoribonuclease IRE2-like n=1 Tax=Phallusia mammillata TaxID=59560 RepID=A0A6F9DCU5_9ASCI|nr:serine/threonine-protein kinase/endoribonuclease IRE2-like [Phallusia mammillata]
MGKKAPPPDFSALFTDDDLSSNNELSSEEQVNACLLIRWMVQKDPNKRPDIDQVKSHPMFWDHIEKVRLIQTVADRIHKPSQKIAERKAQADIASQVQSKENHLKLNREDIHYSQSNASATGILASRLVSEPEQFEKVGSIPDQATCSNVLQQSLEPSSQENPDATLEDDVDQRISNMECLHKDFKDYATSFTTVEELESIEDKLDVTKDTIEEIYAVFKLPTKSMNDLARHMRNKSDHRFEYTTENAKQIGMGENGMDWKKFYDVFTKRVPHFLAHLYHVFWDDEKLTDFRKEMEDKKRD